MRAVQVINVNQVKESSADQGEIAGPVTARCVVLNVRLDPSRKNRRGAQPKALLVGAADCERCFSRGDLLLDEERQRGLDPARATSRNLSGTSSASPPPNSASKCTARRGSGRCSAQLRLPYPCRAALTELSSAGAGESHRGPRAAAWPARSEAPRFSSPADPYLCCSPPHSPPSAAHGYGRVGRPCCSPPHSLTSAAHGYGQVGRPRSARRRCARLSERQRKELRFGRPSSSMMTSNSDGRLKCKSKKFRNFNSQLVIHTIIIIIAIDSKS